MFWNDDNEIFPKPSFLFIQLIFDKTFSSQKRSAPVAYPVRAVFVNLGDAYKRWLEKSGRSLVASFAVLCNPEKRAAQKSLSRTE